MGRLLENIGGQLPEIGSGYVSWFVSFENITECRERVRHVCGSSEAERESEVAPKFETPCRTRKTNLLARQEYKRNQPPNRNNHARSSIEQTRRRHVPVFALTRSMKTAVDGEQDTLSRAQCHVTPWTAGIRCRMKRDEAELSRSRVPQLA